MARPLRIEYPGAVYHVTSRGNERKPIYRTDADRERFLAVLARVTARYHWLCHAYCLMDNHYHLVIETQERTLSRGMRQLNGTYTQAFNRAHERVGHLFQGRFTAIVIHKESYLLEVCRYVVLNPVRATAVRRPDDWPWSSYRATAGLQAGGPALTTAWLLAQFAADRPTAQQRYRGFVRDGIGASSLWDDVEAQCLLGPAEFTESLAAHTRDRHTVIEIPKDQRHMGRPSLAELFAAAHTDRATRDARILDAVDRHGYSQKAVADWLGLHYSTVSRLVNQRGA